MARVFYYGACGTEPRVPTASVVFKAGPSPQSMEVETNGALRCVQLQTVCPVVHIFRPEQMLVYHVCRDVPRLPLSAEWIPAPPQTWRNRRGEEEEEAIREKGGRGRKDVGGVGGGGWEKMEKRVGGRDEEGEEGKRL